MSIEQFDAIIAVVKAGKKDSLEDATATSDQIQKYLKIQLQLQWKSIVDSLN